MEDEGARLLERKVDALRSLPYRELRELIPRRSLRFLGIEVYTADSQEESVLAPSGKTYDLEAEVFWDDEPEGNIRAFVSCHDADSDREWRQSFIVAPDGTFVDG